jgi:hypothetical protein
MSSSSAALLGNSSSSTSSSTQAQWESLRRRSRLLETQLHRQLQQFAHVQTAIMNEGKASKSNAKAQRADLELDSLRATSSSPSSSTASSASPAAASSGSSPLQQYESLASELDELLRSLSDVNDGLARILSSDPTLAAQQSNQYVGRHGRVPEDETEYPGRTGQE